MGYTTEFEGAFKFDKPLSEAHRKYLYEFADTRRMRRNPEITETYADPLREAVGLPVGVAGEYFVGANQFSDGEFLSCAGQARTPDIADYNRPPGTQPGLWCQWFVSEDGTSLYAEGEKFYDYVEWLKYLICNFIRPWGYKLNGTVEWFGEDADDRGKIIVEDNKVTTKVARIVYD